MPYFSDKVKYKADGQSVYTPCNLEIGDGYLAFQKQSIAGIAIGQVGKVGSLIGSAISESAKKKNAVILIPMDQITQVQTKSTFVTAFVIVTAHGHPVYTFACSAKKEMNRIAELLKR